MRKRILSIIIIGILLAESLMVPVFAGTTYSDVADQDWYSDSVRYVSERGYMLGTSEAEFSPGMFATRAMIVTVFWRMAGKPASACSPSFEDVSSDAYYAPAVAWMAEKGIVNGVSGTRFAPDVLITREQMVTICYRYLQSLYQTAISGSIDSYADSDIVSSFAVDAMTWAVGSGLVKGRPSGGTVILAPKDNLTRAEAACLLERLEGLLNNMAADASDADDAPEPSPTSSDTDKRIVRVSFSANCEDEVENMPQTLKVTRGKSIQAPSDPIRPGYNFAAWITDAGDVFSFDTDRVTKNMTLYAAWQEIEEDGSTIFEPPAITLSYEEDYGSYYQNLIDVFLTEDLDDQQVQAIAEAVGGTAVGHIRGAISLAQILVQTSGYSEMEELIGLLREREDVADAYAEFPYELEDAVVAPDPWAEPGNFYPSLRTNTDVGNEKKPAGLDWWAEAIQAFSAWDQYGDKVIDRTTPVGVMDNYIDLNHEDLAGKVSCLKGYENDNSIFSDHGTHVTGIIAATGNNGKGIRGVADFATVKFANLAFKDENLFLAQNSAKTVNLFKKMIDSGVKVINLSQAVRNKSNSEAKKQAAQTARVGANIIYQLINSGVQDFLFVQAAGNGKGGEGKTSLDARTYGGMFTSITQELMDSLKSTYKKRVTYSQAREHYIIVSGLRNQTETKNGVTYYEFDDGLNDGDGVDICAPSCVDVDWVTSLPTGAIFSTIPEDSINGQKTRYDTMRGTSQAAPMVTGAAAFVWGIDPSLTAGEVKKILCSNTKTKVVQSRLILSDIYYPMLNVYDAVQKAYKGRPEMPTGELTVKVLKKSGKAKYEFDAEWGTLDGKSLLNVTVKDVNTPLVGGKSLVAYYGNVDYADADLSDMADSFADHYRSEYKAAGGDYPLSTGAYWPDQTSGFTWSASNGLPVQVVIVHMDNNLKATGYTLLKIS